MLNHLSRARRFYRWLSSLPEYARAVELAAKADYKHPKVLTGALLARMNETRTPRSLADVEFQVFSQFGDDGIIQWLLHVLAIPERTFVEFGVEDYTEANTRFLLVNNKWRGLVLDGDAGHVDHIARDLVTIFYDLTPVRAFIDAGNINGLLRDNGFTGRIGLLSIDIDGVDYWVWKAIDAVDPAIVIAEYNANFGAERAITVPYAADFQRAAAHPSRLYWGASLEALKELGAQKGYAFLGCNANGNNAYFVRADLAREPRLATLEARFVASSFAEYSQGGRPLRGANALAIIKGLPVLNTRTGAVEPL